MSFAALQTRINATALNRLGQDVVLVGSTVRAIFDKEFVASTIGDSGMASTQSMLTLQSASIPQGIADWFASYAPPINPLDLMVAVNDADYKIVACESVDIGMSRLILEAV